MLNNITTRVLACCQCVYIHTSCVGRTKNAKYHVVLRTHASYLMGVRGLVEKKNRIDLLRKTLMEVARC